jgi:dTDP-glucose 4,6-dehydratase
MNVRAIEFVREDLASALAGYADKLAPLKGDTLVVTGGTGFMGTWLAELVAYLNDHHSFETSVVLMARSTDQFRARMPHLANRQDIRLLKSDVRHAVEVPHETNWLIHAAANPDSRFHATSPVETMTVVAEGTAAVLRAVDRCSNFKMFLNVSSGLVYGAQPFDLERIPENYPGAPSSELASSAYAAAKRYAETLCAAARTQARIPAVTARPFAFIGPYHSLETPWAINNFVRDALTGNAIRVLGDGQTVRSYMYPSDMAVWLLTILTQGVSGQVYNLGSPEPVTLAQLADLVSAHCGSQPEIRLGAGMAEMQRQRSRLVPDVSMAQSLGLTVRTDLTQAIVRTLQWNRLVA